MATISVTHLAEDRLRVDVRGHQLLVDQARRGGAEEAGPTPTELFVSGLAACVGHYAARFLRRHGLAVEGLRVDCDWAMLAAQPARVSRLRLRVFPPAAVPDELHAGLQEAMENCAVHNTLRHPPQVTVTLGEPRLALESHPASSPTPAGKSA